MSIDVIMYNRAICLHLIIKIGLKWHPRLCVVIYLDIHINHATKDSNPCNLNVFTTQFI